MKIVGASRTGGYGVRATRAIMGVMGVMGIMGVMGVSNKIEVVGGEKFSF